MTISVTCKKCGKVLTSPARFAGKPVKCPDCNTINRLPDAKAEVCCLCGSDFSADSNRVKDTKRNLYHRDCYNKKKETLDKQRRSLREKEKRRRESKPAAKQKLKPREATCELCGQRFADAANVVKDPHGRYYHRNCYEQEKARLAPLDLSNVPEVDALDEFDDQGPEARA